MLLPDRKNRPVLLRVHLRSCARPFSFVVYSPWTKSHTERNHRAHAKSGSGLDMRAEQISTVFGQVLREQRIARQLSQEELALAADVDRTFVSQMERGIRQPTITTLMKLAGALGIQPSTLVVRMEKLLR